MFPDAPAPAFAVDGIVGMLARACNQKTLAHFCHPSCADCLLTSPYSHSPLISSHGNFICGVSNIYQQLAWATLTDPTHVCVLFNCACIDMAGSQLTPQLLPNSNFPMRAKHHYEVNVKTALDMMSGQTWGTNTPANTHDSGSAHLGSNLHS